MEAEEELMWRVTPFSCFKNDSFFFFWLKEIRNSLACDVCMCMCAARDFFLCVYVFREVCVCV